ncbi:MAG: 23S rRNA (guanosine(2251)-2'-O)-methyltransferase RlmB [Gammaproteobacteria bacterium]|nr:MAG: 23S rRNA (guanosine(2251)-2'-O)-methyltransferase RlmB [Gammaproteobacteria bacterium]
MAQLFGLHAVDSLLRKRPKEVSKLTVQQGRNDKRMHALIELAQNQGVAIAYASRAELDKRVSGRHQGVVAELVGNTPEQGEGAVRWSDKQLLEAVQQAECTPLILVLDGVTDPHNLGACLRSADAAGVLAVVVPKDGSADITPVVAKVACGAAESVPLVRVTNLARTLDALKALGVWVYGAAGEAEQNVFNVDFSGPAAIVLGAEGSGLRRLTRERCDFLVKLPMAGVVSSLNVSVATGICLFEVVRQRQSRQR